MRPDSPDPPAKVKYGCPANVRWERLKRSVIFTQRYPETSQGLGLPNCITIRWAPGMDIDLNNFCCLFLLWILGWVLFSPETWEGTSSYVTVSSSGWWSGWFTPTPQWTRSTAKAQPPTWTRKSMTWCPSLLIASPQVNYKPEWLHFELVGSYIETEWTVL